MNKEWLKNKINYNNSNSNSNNNKIIIIKNQIINKRIQVIKIIVLIKNLCL